MKLTPRTRRAFSLIELVIVVVIIAIIAAIAVPKLSRGASGANDAATMQSLAQMRSAIDLFATEHGGTMPDKTTPATFIAQLTQYTDANGLNPSPTKTTASYFGPYLKSIPPLPVGANKGLATVTCTGPVGTGSFGWYYDGVTIFANTTTEADATQKLYSNY